MNRFHKTILFVAFLPATVIAETNEAAPVDPLSAVSLINMVMGLVMVIAVIFTMAWVVRRMGGMQITGQNKLRLLGGLSLSAREKVVLIQVEDKRMVIGVAPGQVNTLHVFEGEYQPDDADEHSGQPNAFKEKLMQALQKKSS